MTVERSTAAQQIMEIIPLAMRIVSAELRRTDPTLAHSHFGLLCMLAHHSFNLSQLAERQAVSRPTMSNSITTLVQRGWVKRTQSTTDRREVHIELTGAGQAALGEMQNQVKVRIDAMLANLAPADRDALIAGLAILRGIVVPAIHCGDLDQ